MSEESRLREMLEEAKAQIIESDMIIARLMSAPLVHATVVQAKNEFDPKTFECGDLMLVVDKTLRKKLKYPYGRIISEGIKPDGKVTLASPSGKVGDYSVGLNNDPIQVKLIGKDDGTNAVVVVDGKLFEVHGLPGKKLYPSETVKVDMQTYQIHDTTGVSGGGNICGVSRTLDDFHVEVEIDGRSRVVVSGLPHKKLEPGDRVVLDQSSTVIVRLLEREGSDRFNLEEESTTTWNDIAGLAEVKDALIEAIELPYMRPELFKHYNKRPPKGVLLSGPPGCGKTLVAKAAANSLASIHKAKQMQSGFIYVKGPELLSKWVGQSEATIRELFVRGRDHFKKHNYPALMFIDEADAILPQRGSGRSSDVENTIVPMFLSEMDGLESSHVMVMLATNQPQRLDPAVVREGRIDRHIRVGRPTQKNVYEYFQIHMKGIPLKDCDFGDVAAHATAELFSRARPLYKLVEAKIKEHYLTLGDCVSGAMIAGIIDQATSLAMKRDIKKKCITGVMLKDFSEAIERTYHAHAQINATFDIDDFVDKNGIERSQLHVEKMRPVSV